MAFTYSDTLLTDRDRVRFEIGDTVENDGPRPRSGSNSNYSDNEVAAIITAEGGWGKAAARLCETLSNEWTAEAGRIELSDYREEFTDRAELFAARAVILRKRYGGIRGTTQVAVTRVDGFSDDITAEET